MSKYQVIIPAAGHGSRFNHKVPKQYHTILGKTILEWSIAAFAKILEIEQILLVVTADDPYIEELLPKLSPKVRLCRNGGKTRSASVLNGLIELNCQENDWVLTHDAARCCIRTQDIYSLINHLAVQEHGGILASIAVDTVKQVNHDLIITKTLNRRQVYLAQTPQMFRFKQLYAALKLGIDNYTDEAQAIELHGGKVEIIECGKHNFKVTYPQDLHLAEILIAQWYKNF
jgi:2-C-methyl-D-erythritol 4-phosphate cytidylyltransferase